MKPLLQQFEFSYLKGDLFYDRSGRISRRLSEFLPGLVPGEVSAKQKDFSASADIQLFFGVAYSRLQSFFPEELDFSGKANLFLEVISDGLELEELSAFSFRHVLGKACSSIEEAQELMIPVLGAEYKEKMASIAPLPQWRSVQGVFSHSNFLFESTISILDLVPHMVSDPDQARKGVAVPHITFQLEARGQVPISLSDFDPLSFIENFKEKHSQEILSKLAPHLADL